ncbi:MAG: YdcF family protein, partial [Bacteroidales bacterium]
PLQHADAVLVLAGTFAERPLEAADLYRAGFAPLIVLTREAPDGGQQALAHRGMPMPDRTDLARDMFARLGIPPAAILTLGDAHDSTADEARSFRELVKARRWHSVIVVTSKMHTRRARMTMSRMCRGLGVEVLVRASRYDRADPAHWWRQRSDARFVLFEVQKYVLYWLGAMQ